MDTERQGLSSSEAARRLRSEGPNELPRAGRRRLATIAFEVVREPLFGLLLAGGAVYLLLGDLAEALVLLGFATLSVGIAIVQQSRSERVLEALRDLTSPRALVIRDRQRTRIAGREVVRGDLVVLSEGDRIPADGRLIWNEDFLVDESLLTGEAIAVVKHAAPPAVAAHQPDSDHVFSGTLVVRGQAIAEVTATGGASRIGRIGRSLATIEPGTPRLARETADIVRTVAVLGLVCCLTMVLLYGWLYSAWMEALLAGIALGMAMLPEEFPLVLTVFTVMGAWRLSRVHVLTRRAAAIEALGSASVLCCDKTGTMTENRMAIVELRTPDAIFRPAGTTAAWPTDMRHLLECGVLASATAPFDPMEKAFHAAHSLAGPTGNGVADTRQLRRSWPLRPDFLAVTQAWQEADSERHLIAVKGAPETILDLCSIDAETRQQVMGQLDAMAQDGMRVLGVAKALHETGDLPQRPQAFQFRFLGLVGLADPLRATVPAAVRECHQAGIRVVMITGDYPRTAASIARQAGLSADLVLTGSDIARLSDADLSHAISSISVFARIMPEQKLRLVQALKARGEVVAMTGDGVNDAPALKAADIGIAMGSRGTDVAREAAAIVLLDDDFTSIVRTIRLGRRIYDNLRKAMSYILAIHVPIAGLALLPLFAGLPILLTPIHIAFLEMVIDPVCSVVFESEREEEDIMQRPPRAEQSKILSLDILLWSLAQGVIALTALGVILIQGAAMGMADADLRTLVFIALVAVNLALALVNRSYGQSLLRRPRRSDLAMALVASAALGIMAIAVFWAPARTLFGFGSFHWHDLAIVLLVAVASAVTLEGLKRLWRRRLFA